MSGCISRTAGYSNEIQRRKETYVSRGLFFGGGEGICFGYFSLPDGGGFYWQIPSDSIVFKPLGQNKFLQAWSVKVDLWLGAFSAFMPPTEDKHMKFRQIIRYT